MVYLCRQDHPHACGDKKKSYILFPIVTGSSPRVWGQGVRATLKRYHTRIIPTRVGTRAILSSCAVSRWDHPHACGDKQCITICLQQAKGSSPRVWGQGVRRLAKRHSCRIIPTRVGTSFFKYQRRFQLQDHPHACGDKICDAVITQFFIGSSPRVWGQALPDLVGSKTDGIIPTRVGTSVCAILI